MADAPELGHPTRAFSNGDQQEQGAPVGVTRAEGPYRYLERYPTDRRGE